MKNSFKGLDFEDCYSEDDVIYRLYQQNLAKGMDEDDAYMEAQSEVYSRACEENGVDEQGDRDYR